MKQFKYLSTSVFLLYLLFSSCSDDVLLDSGGPVITSGRVTLRGEFSIPMSSLVATRSSGKDENTLDSLYVFVFNDTFTGSAEELANGGPKLMEVARVEELGDPGPNNNGTFKVHLTAGTDRKLIYILANVPLGAQYPSGDYSGDNITLGKVCTDLKLGQSTAGYQTAKIPYPLPMSGSLLLPGGIDSSTHLYRDGDKPVPLVRAVAKISLELASSVDNFRIRGVAVSHVANGGHIISSVPAPAGDVFDTPDMRDGVSAGNSHFYDDTKQDQGAAAFLYHPADSLGILADNIYVYETKATDKQPVRLIVLGEYQEGAPSYYALDIINKDTTAFDMVRNHHYKVTINKVDRLGMSTFTDALSASAFNKELGVDVRDTTTTTTTTVIGNYIYSLDYDHVTLYADSLESFTLSVLSTNYPRMGDKPENIANLSNRLSASSNGSTLLFSNGSTTATFPLIYSDEVKGYPITVHVKPGFEEGSINLHLGGYTKVINVVKKSHFLDLHYDSLSVDNVRSIRLLSSVGGESGKSWATLSRYSPYLPNHQTSFLTFDTPSRAYIYVDENLALSERASDFEYVTGDNDKRRLYLGQVGNARYDIGFFGGGMSNNSLDKANYGQRLFVEGYEEEGPFRWLPEGISPDAADYPVLTGADGIASTLLLANDYHSPAALYCLNKNRDKNGNGVIDDNEVVWYLPTVYQGLGISFYQAAVDNVRDSYWSSSLFVDTSKGYDRLAAFALNTYTVGEGNPEYPNSSGFSGPQLSTAYWAPVSGVSYITKGWERYVRCVRNY